MKKVDKSKLQNKSKGFIDEYIKPLVKEAKSLKIECDELISSIKENY